MTPNGAPRPDRELLLTMILGAIAVVISIIVMALRQLTANLELMNGSLGRHDTRIYALEKWRWVLAGALIILGPLVPFLIYEFRQTIVSGLGG